MNLLKICTTALICAALLSACQPEPAVKQDREMQALINGLMKKMTLEEKVGQLNLLAWSGEIVTGQASSTAVGKKIREGRVGALLNIKSVDKIREVQRIAVEESRLGIPLLFGMDIIHGYRTTFPIPLALASTFDPDLIGRSARIAATEASADGICWTFSPMVDICRDPRWGRIAEGAGEDAYLGSRIAEAYVRGFQGDDLSADNTIMACVKHFAMYGAPEGGRDYNTTDMSRIRMYNEYLPPYLAAVKAGAGSVMTAFNEVDGIPATANKWLLTGLLRNEWGFNGFIVTDYTSINEMTEHGMGYLQEVSALALDAGVDLDMVGEGFSTTLLKSMDEGWISENQINQACRRILEAKYKLGLFDDPYRYCNSERARELVGNQAHKQAAREIASQSFVLLKNEHQLLPLEQKGKIALIGPLADSRFNMAGMWSVGVDHNESVTVVEGFREAVGDRAEVIYARGSNITDDPVLDRNTATYGIPDIDPVLTPEQMRREAVATALKCDVIVAVVGESAEMSGEAASKTDLSLPGSQLDLLKALAATGKPVVMVLFTGRPLTINWEKEHLPAILNVWFGGSQAGHAIADVIFGKVNPSGKLPVTFPQHVGQIPLYYNHKNTGRPHPENEPFLKYRSNYLDMTNEPLFPFGFGLSYTQFSYGEPEFDRTGLSWDQTLVASITVTNTGQYAGTEVVQLYIRDMIGSITRPVKELKGFQKINLQPGETEKVTFTITTDDLRFYNSDLRYDWEPGEFEIMIGGNSREVKSGKATWLR